MCLPSISMAEKRRKPWNPYKTFENQARGRIAAHIRAVDETHPAFPKPITEKRQNNRPAYAPSTAVIPTVAIHHGDHGTYEPAGTIIIEQHSRQQTTKQTVVRKFRFRQTETTEAMTRMKHIQRSKPAIIGRHDSIQWNGIVKTAIFEGHSSKSNLQHGDVMLQHESVVRRDGIQCKGVISCHSHSNLFVGFLYQPLGDGPISLK